MTSVTKLHLLCGGTGSASQELVTQADTKDGGFVLLHNGGDVLDGSLENGGVTGTVGDEETVVLLAGGLGQVVVPWADHDLNAALEEAAQLVVFHTDVDAQNTNGAAGGVLANTRRGGLVELGCLDGDYNCH